MTDTYRSEWQAWRRDERQRLLALRSAMPSPVRRDLGRRVVAHLDPVVRGLPCKVLGIYWPIKREINLLDWAEVVSRQRNLILALPVVTEPRAPLEYWRWYPNDTMNRGVWNIPVPAQRNVVDPDIVIAPLVGFSGCWRLGYGGGYFDRTLAARAAAPPAAVGVGFDMMELPDFAPKPHDVPMRAVVTESGVIKDETVKRQFL